METTMSQKRVYDPLAVVPSAKAIRDRLDEVRDQVRRLKILLRTADWIEQDQRQSEQAQQNPAASNTGTTRQGGDE